MIFLEDDKIVEIIDGYISENSYNYSILLNGEWGSGKTYFIKEILLPKLKELIPDKKAIYVSLYGLHSPEEIDQRIFSATVELRMGKGKKLLPIMNGAINILTDVLGNTIGSPAVSEADTNIFSPFISYADYYFVFDDLERCGIAINSVLGHINYFLERNNAKILLVANEKEIGSIEIQENIFSRYHVAMSDKIHWPKQPKEELFPGTKTYINTTTWPDIEEIKWRSTLIDNEKNIIFVSKRN